MIVDVIQFMRPHGRQVPLEVEVSDSCKEKYDLLTGYNLRLTCEQLMNGTVSQAVEGPDFDFDIELTGGSDLTENKAALEKLIMRFDLSAFATMEAAYKA